MLNILQETFFIVLTISILSALLLFYPRMPLKYVRIHVGIISLPPIVALMALIFQKESVIAGPWHFNTLTWLLAFFVLTMGLIVQRFSIHYLYGDSSYKKYFSLLTLVTIADSLAWLSDDLRVLLAGWGITLLGLAWIIGLKNEWQVARKAAKYCGRLFTISWLLLVTAVVWLALETGFWQMSHIFTQDSLTKLDTWEKTAISLLIIGAVVITAAQWPFQRWLLDSVVAPTPVSAVMHAGIVNGGGMILTLFAPLFNGNGGQIILILLSSISVLIGTGIMLVHVDYKRQLVGSTIAQMGFMLIQCGLGAYTAAIIHAILHGIFKATLFLQSGSVIQHQKVLIPTSQPSLLWKIFDWILGLLAGIGFWLTASGDGYQLVSSLILGVSVSLGWKQLVAFENSLIGRLVGLTFFTVGAAVYWFIHSAFHYLLHDAVVMSKQPSMLAGFLLLIILLGGSAFGSWLSRHRTTKLYALIYLWLVQVGEPQKDFIQTHPKYLTTFTISGR